MKFNRKTKYIHTKAIQIPESHTFDVRLALHIKQQKDLVVYDNLISWNGVFLILGLVLCKYWIQQQQYHTVYNIPSPIILFYNILLMKIPLTLLHTYYWIASIQELNKPQYNTILTFAIQLSTSYYKNNVKSHQK